MIMPSANATKTSIKHIILPERGPPTGTILLHDLNNGKPRALIDAKEVTALRTALGSVWPVVSWWGINPTTVPTKIVMFGGGKQVEYAIRLLTTLLRFPGTSLSFTIVARSSRSVDTLKAYIDDLLPTIDISFHIDPPASVLKGLVIAADGIFCCTPSTVNLFDSSWLLENKKKRYISLIGSYTPQMTELNFQTFSSKETRILLDHEESCYQESGELINLMNSYPAEDGSGSFKESWDSSIKSLTEVFDVDGELRGENCDWLVGDQSVDTLIYKGVGHATMDLGAAEAILEIVVKRGGGSVEVEW